MRPFRENTVYLSKNIRERWERSMRPPELFFHLHQQHHQEMMQQAEHSRLVWVRRQRPASHERVCQHLLWWVGEAPPAWGCALKPAGPTSAAAIAGKPFKSWELSQRQHTPAVD